MDRPKITDAPGLTWRRNQHGWQARWRARTDIYKKGYGVPVVTLWAARGDCPELTDGDIAYIQSRCQSLQAEMLVWARGGIPTLGAVFDGTLSSLCDCYRSDPDSSYRRNTRHRTRLYYDALCRRIVKNHGGERITDIKARHVLRWHEDWIAGGKVTMAHALIRMLRTVVAFGSTILEDAECERVSGFLSNMRFKMPKARDARLEAKHVIAIRAKAHEMGSPSIALAQAFQFDMMLRQKDVIGEYVPMAEPGLSDVIYAGQKWLYGIRWEEIDANQVLRHITSKRQKPVEVQMALAPMVLEELALMGALPERGPIVLNEHTGRPWNDLTFRRRWREIATAAGVPTNIRNMDTRAGAISEATDAGAELEHVRHAATHGDISMTQRYSRGGADKTRNVMEKRVEFRARTKQKPDDTQ
jgi:hypothetical protein